MLETAWESRWLPDKTKITPLLCRQRDDNKTGVREDANLDQQGSADHIELVLPVIRGFKPIEISND